MGGLENRKYVLLAEYDFEKDGGAIGDITLRGGRLPAGAVVTSGVIDVKTGLTAVDALAEAAINIEAAGDVLASGVVTALTAGLHDVVPAGTAATMAKTTASRQPVLTVAIDALTAGKLTLCLEYVITD